MTRGDRVIAFIERFCLVPEGPKVGQPIKLLTFQKKFIKAIFDGNRKVRRAYLSIARKNGKTALIACLVLAFLVGPEAVQNSQIISGARSRDQAALVFNLAEKMVRLSPELSKIVRIVPSGKRLIGLRMNVEYRAISAEAGTAHGLSPILAIIDEAGQIRGEHDAFVEAIETSQGAHEDPILIAISTQAATDDDLFSRWLDDAAEANDPAIVSHVYSAPPDCDLTDRKAWRAANPAMGKFRSLEDVKTWAQRAQRSPAEESSFRWLFLNQRIEAHEPYVSPTIWAECGGEPGEIPDGATVFGGLDLSSSADLTAYVRVAWNGDDLCVWPRFWLPEQGLRDKAREDREPYDRWKRDGFLETTPGATVDYDQIAPIILDDLREGRLHWMSYDRWNWAHFWAALDRAGATAKEIGDSPKEGGKVIRCGQGYQSMSPALRSLDEVMLNGRLRHGNHPVLTMCARNAVVQMDPAGNRKLAKLTRKRRIDGMIALAMATAAAGQPDLSPGPSVYEERGLVFI